MISPDSCGKSLVAGRYDVIIGEDSPAIQQQANSFYFRDISTNQANQINNPLTINDNDIHQIHHDNNVEREQSQQTIPIEDTYRSVMINFLERFHRLESEINQPESGYNHEFKILKDFSKTLKENKANLEDGEHEQNLKKNRYKDILPFNHTRVILSGEQEIPGSGYINANYIRGPSGSSQAYIASQGPLTCTLVDFWRMIWECNVSVVVMACNEFESGKPKCELYWPEKENDSQFYGNFEVTLLKVRQVCEDFLIRKLSLRVYASDPNDTDDTNTLDNCNDPSDYGTIGASTIGPVKNTDGLDSNNNNNDDGDRCNSNVPNLNGTSPKATTNKCDLNSNTKFNTERRPIAERIICQFHYTTWPDHGAPHSVHPILHLVRLMREVHPSEDKPIVVHCSAGCGRTGTICCIDYVWGLMRRGKLDHSFDLHTIIKDMRQQRMAMVQTIEQYTLCHRAVAALFINQLNLIDNHIYENLELAEDTKDEPEEQMTFEEQDLGPVFI